MHLLASQRFLPLFITQFFGAFNDNLFKNALVMLIAYKATGYTPEQANFLVVTAGALFMLPYFLFSATAGQLADKYDRARLSRITKLWEVIVVAIGAIGFLGHHTIFLLIMLFGLGVQSTFFSPVKYALLPQHLPDDELVIGNAYIEAGTFLAILLGTITGGILIMQPSGEVWIVAISILVAVVGYLVSRFIPAAPAPMPALSLGWNIMRETWHMVAHDRKNVRVFQCILAISWFWLVGAVFLSQFPALVRDVFMAEEGLVTLLLAMFSVGIGLGSFLSNWLVRGAIDSRFVPLAAWGMALFTCDLAGALLNYTPLLYTPVGVWEFLGHFNHIRMLLDLLMIAVCAGIFIVPLYAIMQHDSEVETRARTIATNNIVNALFMIISALATILCFKLGGGIAHVFLILAIGNLYLGFYIRKVRTKTLS